MFRSEFTCLYYLVSLRFFSVGFFTMETFLTMSRKEKKDILACDGGLDCAMTGVGSSSNWGVFPLDGDKIICNRYDGFVIPLSFI